MKRRASTPATKKPAESVKRPSPKILPEIKTVNVADLLWKGIQLGIDAGRVQDATKAGLMRGGSQGLFLSMEQPSVGHCHRAALARMRGAEPPREDEQKWREKHLMFDSGHANEDSWVANLERSWPGIILREEEFPISWKVQTEDGNEAHGSGREDIILAWPTEKPGCKKFLLPDGRTIWAEQLVELKQISSLNKAVDVLFASGKPGLDNAVQAGRYSLATGLPVQVWYTLPFVLPVPEWSFILAKMPAKGEPFSEPVDYSPKTGKPTKVQPTAAGYQLRWVDGVLHYARIGLEDRGFFPTIVQASGLDDFWRYVLDVPTYKDLGARPVALDIHGNKLYYSPCDYCDWRTTCDSAEDGAASPAEAYDKWEKLVAERVMVPAEATTMHSADTKKESK